LNNISKTTNLPTLIGIANSQKEILVEDHEN